MFYKIVLRQQLQQTFKHNIVTQSNL